MAVDLVKGFVITCSVKAFFSAWRPQYHISPHCQRARLCWISLLNIEYKSLLSWVLMGQLSPSAIAHMMHLHGQMSGEWLIMTFYVTM